MSVIAYLAKAKPARFAPAGRWNLEPDSDKLPDMRNVVPFPLNEFALYRQQERNRFAPLADELLAQAIAELDQIEGAEKKRAAMEGRAGAPPGKGR